MKFKDAPARFFVKAADERESDDPAVGEFEALVSVFGNVDVVNDRVVKGAFAKSIDRWNERGDPVPVIYSHQHSDPNALLGGVVKMAETADGLWVKGQLDLDLPAAAAVHRHMKARRLTKFSFAYDTLDSKQADDGVNELTELDIIEVGPTVIPANPATELLSVKGSLDVKRGRVLSAANERALRAAHAAITDVLALVESDDDDSSDDDSKSRSNDLTRALAASARKFTGGRW